MDYVKAWPFLISKSKKLEFTTIVAPDFMCNENTTLLLRKAVSKYVLPTEEGEAIYLEIIVSDSANYVLIFRTTWASTKYIGQEEDERLYDPDRPIPFIEGFVLCKPLEINTIAVANFDRIHNQVIEHYKNFWESDIPITTNPSESFDLQMESDSQASLNLVRKPTFKSEKFGSSSGQSWKCIKILKSEDLSQEVCSVAFIPKNDNKIAIRYSDQVVKIWDFWDWKNQSFYDLESCEGNSQSSIAVSPDGKLIATGIKNESGKSIFRIWDSSKSTKIQDIELRKNVYAATFYHHPKNGEFIMIGSKGDTIELYNRENQSDTFTLWWNNYKTGESNSLCCLTVSPDGKYVVGGDQRGLWIVWDCENAKQLDYPRGVHSDRINSVSFHPKSKMFASASDDGNIKLWNLSGTKSNSIWNKKISSRIKSISFSPNGHKIASVSSNGQINIWNVKNGEEISGWVAHKEEITSVAFSSQGLLASGSKDGTVKIWKEDN